MKKDEILDVLGGIGAEYIDMAAEEVSQEEVKRKKRRRLLWLIPAAAVLVLGVIFVPGWIRKSNTPEQRLLKAITPAADTLQSDAAHFAELPVEKRVAWYTEVYVGPKDRVIASADYEGSTEVLTPFIGEKYTETDGFSLWGTADSGGTQTWYRVRDVKELKYLISEDKTGKLRLWKFTEFVTAGRYEKDSLERLLEAYGRTFPDCNDFSPYTYGDVYRLIYRVESAADIESVTARADRSNNTPEGWSWQLLVGEKTVSDAKQIEAFYNVTKDVVLNEPQDWAVFRENRTRFRYSFIKDDNEELLDSLEKYGILGSRVLTVALKSGTTIEGMQYVALNGVFAGGGVFVSEPLPEEDVMTLNEIFGIH